MTLDFRDYGDYMFDFIDLFIELTLYQGAEFSTRREVLYICLQHLLSIASRSNLA